MQNTKKIAIFALSTLIVAGWAYLFRDSVLFDGLSSRVLNTSFICTESNLQSQSARYRQTTIRYRKALVVQRNLEEEIAGKVDMSGEVQAKQNSLRILQRQIRAYNRFITYYDTCQIEVHLLPSVSVGLMSGEARVVPSQTSDYQELAAFAISSPANLTTFLNVLQFQVRITPATSLTIDQWFLASDGWPSALCQSSQSGESVTVDCDMSVGLPASIAGTTQTTYRLWAHIVSVEETAVGSMEISVVGLVFNDGREGVENNIPPITVRYGDSSLLPPIAQPDTILPPADIVAPPPPPPPASDTSLDTALPPATDWVDPPVSDTSSPDVSGDAVSDDPAPENPDTAPPPVADTSTPPADTTTPPKDETPSSETATPPPPPPPAPAEETPPPPPAAETPPPTEKGA